MEGSSRQRAGMTERSDRTWPPLGSPTRVAGMGSDRGIGLSSTIPVCRDVRAGEAGLEDGEVVDVNVAVVVEMG